MNQNQKHPDSVARTLLTVFANCFIGAAITAIFAVSAYFIGISAYENVTRMAYIITLVLMFISIMVGDIAGKTFIAKMNKLPVAERIDMMKAQQSATRNSLEMAEARIKRLQNGFVFTYAWYILGMIVMSLAVYTSNPDEIILRALVPWIGWWMLLMHWRDTKVSYDFSGYTKLEDYPVMYDIAQRAQNAVGISGEIKIIFTNDCNAGIAKMGKVYSLQLGVQLLSILTEEEIYQVLLHEFAHMTDAHIKNNLGLRYRLQLLSESEHMTVPLTQMTLYIRAKFLFELMMYQMLASEQMETKADNVMQNHGNPYVSATALCKTAMQTFFEREFDTFVPEPFHAPEKPRENAVTLQCEAIRTAITQRKDFWMHLLEIELPPQVQSHPTFAQRRASLGMSDTPLEITLPTPDSAYDQEWRRAAKALDKKMFDIISERYEQDRAEYYLAPLSIIEDYQNATIPYTTAELSPVINAYRDLGRKAEAMEICEGILATEQNKFATAHSLYFKGRYLLGQYDAQGIDYLYQAIELNMNYAEEGLEAIGEFCCMMGLEQEREVYRQKFVELTQERMDKYDAAGILTAGDHLVAEEFPDNRLDAMLLFMKRAGNGCIWQIHLVRKVITDDFFASAFVIRFVDGTDNAQINKTMEAIFNFLDTTPEDWQYALFLYDKSIEKALHKVPNSCVWDCNKV